MNLLIFGATGDTGRELVKQALALGHTVTAFSRHASDLVSQYPTVKVAEGDVTDLATVEQAVQGQDAVLSALGSASLKRNPALVEGVQNIVKAMEKHQVRRLIYQSSLGVGDSRKQVSFLVRYIIIPLVLRNAIADHADKERIIQQSSLDWVIVRPAGLTNDDRTGEYRAGETIEFGARIARADVADFMLKQVTEDAYLKQTPGVSY
ncbi:SDR family oxidoreductase [Nodosilinea sp. E11]|uniref:NAD(P)-dependent oxidoreductase n=1 Tax=Nodosilinea sp. E11 TaxID=3037479 RepID=UPI0029347678|nr:SDR family oxidoreductase [Nodosilinea sp. E11]WOD41698.1 SDR family oxidoreductase [Nodosilinea sp. E11]